mmetsp:Transcript_25159/g.57880  ORF Transcript_25159/g.57880 Transcript_25159/m.57880 type:complete len:281 (+) Transcript_25159:198-1040(+)
MRGPPKSAHSAQVSIFVRMSSHAGEAVFFKNDKGRFSADINKTHTVKLRSHTAYKVTIESPKNMRVGSLSIQGTPVEVDEVVSAHRQEGDGEKEKVRCTGIWRTDMYPPTETSSREKLEWVLVMQVDGLRGPESDERHLLRTKMICKFYAPDYAKFEDKGHALGAIKIRAAIRENSKVLSVTYADVAHTSKLEDDHDDSLDTDQLVTETPGATLNTKPVKFIERGGAICAAPTPPDSPAANDAAASHLDVGSDGSPSSSSPGQETCSSEWGVQAMPTVQE